MKISSKNLVLVLLALGVGVFAPRPNANAEVVGTSQEDLPNLVARFIIDNQTDVPVSCAVKCGNAGKCSIYTQAAHDATTHSHPLSGPNRAPQPYVHFG